MMFEEEVRIEKHAFAKGEFASSRQEFFNHDEFEIGFTIVFG